jgi:DNA polymerase-1
MDAKPVLYLIDGSSQMYRAFHAPVRTGEGSALRTAAGVPTNAVYIFITMLRKLLKEQAPRYIMASFDLPGPTFRDDLAPDYKANRAPMPDDLAAQIPLVHRACEALGVPIVTMPGYEADDVIGTLATQAVAAGYAAAIVTSDKDFFQLVHGGIKIFNPREDGIWYDEAGVKEKFGVPPAQVVDVLSLMGDSIDNVKGVPGIGEKGARDLITTYGSLDALLQHAADVPQKRYREALLANAAAARDSRVLLTIQTALPIPFDIGAFEYTGPARQACYELFSELGFRSLLNDYAPTAATTAPNYTLVRTREELAALVAALASTTRIGMRVLPDRPVAMQAKVLGVAISAAPGSAAYVPTHHQGMHAGDQLHTEDVLAALAPVLTNAAVEKIGHDLKFDIIVLGRYGLTLSGVGLDTMLASYVLDATRSDHSLERVALEHLGYRALSDEDVLGKGARATSADNVPPEQFLAYAGERADLALRLRDTLEPMLVKEQLDAVYRDLERPLIPVLASIERAGVRIDTGALAAQSQMMEKELARVSSAIYEAAGEIFNINSPKQLSEILFDKLGLPSLKRNAKTRTASTAVDVLEELAVTHDLPRLILDWRGLQKLKGTYVDALPGLVNAETGRVHTSFNQAVAATGRLSSSDPNLQNIPIRTELGRQIRRAFVAAPGFLLISADYSQIELRVLAHLAQDATLIRAFEAGEDIHEQTAAKVFGPASGLDPHEARRRAKIINFSLLYGKTSFTLAKDIGVTPQAAQSVIDAYFAGFPSVRDYIDSTVEDARRTGMVKTMFGRRRLVPELNSRNGQERAAAERAAVNHPIQGTAADILKRAMIDVDAALRGASARMILTVHDELLFEVPAAESRPVADLVKRTMESAVALRVPLTVDVGIGENWKDAKP